MAAGVKAQGRALRGDVELLHKAPGGFLLTEAIPEEGAEELAGPDPGESAPDGLVVSGAESGPVHGVFHQALAFPVGDQRIGQRAVGRRGAAAEAPLRRDEPAGGGGKALSPAEGELHPLPLGTALGILGPLRGEEGEEHLLHSVLICETVQV